MGKKKKEKVNERKSCPGLPSRMAGSIPAHFFSLALIELWCYCDSIL
jgi:hypothetical protein